jgi:membrane protein
MKLPRPVRSGVLLLRRTIEGFVADNCMQEAAALSYYATFSLPAILAVAMSVAEVFYTPEEVRGELNKRVNSAIGPEGAQSARPLLSAASQSKPGTVTSIVGICMVLVGATGVMVELQAAMNQAWEVASDPTHSHVKRFVLKRLLSLVMVLVIAALLLVSLVVNTAFTAFGEGVQTWLPAGLSGQLVEWAHRLVTFVLIALLFAAMFKFLPDAPIPWRDVWPGALVTALLFVVGNFLVGLYLGHSNPASAYGAAGSLAIILIWIYYAAMTVLLGAEFTRAWATVIRGERPHAEPRTGHVDPRA